MLRHDAVTAYVQIGGRSKRMGFDKVTATVGGVPLAARVVAAARPVVAEVVLVGAPRAELESLGCRWLADYDPPLGPLGGIVAALRDAPTPWTLQLAGDLALLQSDVLGKLCSLAEGDERILAPVDDEGYAQTLCALYSKHCLADGEEAVANRSLALHQFFDRCGGRSVPFTRLGGAEIVARALRDTDTPEALELARSLAGARTGKH